MRIFLGHPTPDAIDIDCPTLDIGTADLKITKDGRTIEVPNLTYVQQLEKAVL